MKPDEENKNQSINNNDTPLSQQAAAQLVRAQIDDIYEKNIDTEPSQPQTVKQDYHQTEYISPYKRTHTESPEPEPDK